MRFARHLAVVALASLTAGLVAGAPSAVAARTDAAVELPTSIAALGDSITRGFNACGFYRDCTRRSWATGDDGGVGSHRRRLQEAGAVLTEANLARTGAKSEDLPRQAMNAVALGAQYVTIEIGANDACRRTPEDMTSLYEYEGHIRDALNVLRQGVPNAKVFVASIPDLRRLWSVGHTSWYIRKAWDKLGICRSMLENPGSFAKADVDRRNQVRTRTILYNQILEDACAEYGPLCRFDGKAVFQTSFTRGQLSKWDFFHPSAEGQWLLAQITWQHGFFADLMRN